MWVRSMARVGFDWTMLGLNPLHNPRRGVLVRAPAGHSGGCRSSGVGTQQGRKLPATRLSSALACIESLPSCGYLAVTVSNHILIAYVLASLHIAGSHFCSLLKLRCLTTATATATHKGHPLAVAVYLDLRLSCLFLPASH